MLLIGLTTCQLTLCCTIMCRRPGKYKRKEEGRVDRPRWSWIPSLLPAKTRFNMARDEVNPIFTCSMSRTRPKMPSGTTQFATKGGLFVFTQCQNASSAAVLPAVYMVNALLEASTERLLRALIMASWLKVSSVSSCG